MASRSTVRCLIRGAELGESIVNNIKPRIHSSKAISITKRVSKHANSGRRTIYTTISREILTQQAALTPAAQRGYASQAENEIKRTVLYDLHASKKAKFVPFAGYSMPLYYDDLSHVESHHWTREKASIFDVSHMYGTCRAAPLC